jgi:tetratricopeptide (TPR) repeat protein
MPTGMMTMMSACIRLLLPIGIVLALAVARPVLAADTLASIRQQIDDGFHARALVALDDYLAQHPDSSRAMFLKGVALSGAGKLVAAEKIYLRLLQSGPAMPEVYNNLAVIYARQGKLRQSQDMLEKGMRTNSHYATLYDNLSRVYVEMARDSYIKALQLGQKPEAPELAMIGDSDELQPPVTTVQLASADSVKAEYKPAPVVDQKPPLVQRDRNKSRVMPPLDTSQVVDSVKTWAHAWESQDVQAYLSHYASDFKPAKGISRKRWEARRRDRVRSPRFINIKLEHIHVSVLDQDKVLVKLIQHYKADHYQDVTHKNLTMVYRGQRWQILREESKPQ